MSSTHSSLLHKLVNNHIKDRPSVYTHTPPTDVIPDEGLSTTYRARTVSATSSRPKLLGWRKREDANSTTFHGSQAPLLIRRPVAIYIPRKNTEQATPAEPFTASIPRKQQAIKSLVLKTPFKIGPRRDYDSLKAVITNMDKQEQSYSIIISPPETCDQSDPYYASIFSSKQPLLPTQTQPPTRAQANSTYSPDQLKARQMQAFRQQMASSKNRGKKYQIISKLKGVYESKDSSICSSSSVKSSFGLPQQRLKNTRLQSILGPRIDGSLPQADESEF